MMGLETGTYINSLNASNPVGTDAKSAGDDHIRLVKSTIKNTCPNVAGAVTPTHTELNYVDGVTSAIQTQLDAKQTTNANLTAEAGLTGAANKLAYYTGAGAKALTDFLAWGRTFLAAANVADARTALGAQETLVSGTNIKTVNGESLLGSTDIQSLLKVSSNDTTGGYLNGKLVAGTGITLTENNNGANETLTVAAAWADVGVLGVGTIAMCMNDGSTVTSGSTTAGSNLALTTGWRYEVGDSSNYNDIYGGALSGTWRNIGGASAASAGGFGLFQRIS
jgi:hypothetical protein